MARCIEFNEYEIIEKALNVFCEKGYQGTSMQDLVDAMQINRSSLYNTIGDKHDLFIKCVASYSEAIILETQEIITKQNTALQTLISIILEKASWIITSDKGCLGMKTVFEVAQEDVEVRTLLSKNTARYLDMLSNLIQKAIDDGELNKELEADVLAEFILTSFTGWKQSFILNSNPLIIKKMSEYLIKSITIG